MRSDKARATVNASYIPEVRRDIHELYECVTKQDEQRGLKVLRRMALSKYSYVVTESKTQNYVDYMENPFK